VDIPVLIRALAVLWTSSPLAAIVKNNYMLSPSALAQLSATDSCKHDQEFITILQLCINGSLSSVDKKTNVSGYLALLGEQPSPESGKLSRQVIQAVNVVICGNLHHLLTICELAQQQLKPHRYAHLYHSFRIRTRCTQDF
jgi:hypothetical protein